MTRTDNDTWDLASSVGATATLVAAARAVANNADEPLIDDPYAEPLVRAVGVEFFTRWASGELDASQIHGDDASWGLEHMPYAMAARTQYFDGFFAAAAQAGIRQAVILAAGLDSRAYRLSWPDGTTVYEIDQPQVVAFKRATLTGIGATPTARLKSLAIDLREDWATTLTDAGFDSAQPSAWIAEGLFGYLPPEAQDALLDAVTDLSAPGSMLGTEGVPFDRAADYDDAQTKLRETTDRWRDSGLNLDFSELIFPGERNDVAEYLAARGWESDVVTMSALLEGKGYPAIPEADGMPSMADIRYSTSHRQG